MSDVEITEQLLRGTETLTLVVVHFLHGLDGRRVWFPGSMERLRQLGLLPDRSRSDRRVNIGGPIPKVNFTIHLVNCTLHSVTSPIGGATTLHSVGR